MIPVDDVIEVARSAERNAVIAYLLAQAEEHHKAHKEARQNSETTGRYADMRDALKFAAERIGRGTHRIAQ